MIKEACGSYSWSWYCCICTYPFRSYFQYLFQETVLTLRISNAFVEAVYKMDGVSNYTSLINYEVPVSNDRWKKVLFTRCVCWLTLIFTIRMFFQTPLRSNYVRKSKETYNLLWNLNDSPGLACFMLALNRFWSKV